MRATVRPLSLLRRRRSRATRTTSLRSWRRRLLSVPTSRSASPTRVPTRSSLRASPSSAKRRLPTSLVRVARRAVKGPRRRRLLSSLVTSTAVAMSVAVSGAAVVAPVAAVVVLARVVSVVRAVVVVAAVAAVVSVAVPPVVVPASTSATPTLSPAWAHKRAEY